MSLPSFNTSDRILSMMQSQWATQLNPLLLNPIVNGRLTESITLSAGDNTINHKLGRKLVGYFACLKSTTAVIFDKQSTNQMSDLTLILNSSAPCVVTLWVF